MVFFASLYENDQKSKAAETQEDFANKAIDVQREQFETATELLRPFVELGALSSEAQGNLLGLFGADAEQQAIEDVRRGPLYSGLLSQGEEAILQNASATGGLRGGNIQDALARFRPQLLSQTINDRLNRLQQTTAMGQSAAAGQGASGQTLAANVGNLLQEAGAARAGGYLANASTVNNAINQVAGLVGASAGVPAGSFGPQQTGKAF